MKTSRKYPIGFECLACLFFPGALLIWFTLATWITSGAYMMKVSDNYVIVPCPQVYGTVTGVEQLKYTNGTILHLDIVRDEKIVKYDYNLKIRPATDVYKNGDHLVLYVKCYNEKAKSGEYKFEEQSYKKMLNDSSVAAPFFILSSIIGTIMILSIPVAILGR